MKLYQSSVDECSGFKRFAILPINDHRALFGLYYGYFCLFYRIFHTNFQLINTSDSILNYDYCDLDQLTRMKILQFYQKEPSIKDKIIWFIKVNILKRQDWARSKERENYLLSNESLRSLSISHDPYKSDVW